MKTFFMILAIVASSLSSARAEGACSAAGALECDATGTRVTACTRSGSRSTVRDCAAINEVCAEGRCTPANFTRAVSCEVPGENGCSSDCEYVTLCSSSNVWVTVSKCAANTLCVNGKCVSSSTNICRTSSAITCGESSKGQSFPNLEDCGSFFQCEEEWSAPTIKYCSSGYYDPCSGACSLASPLPCNQYEPCTSDNEGLDTAIFGNPSLHYTCAAGSTVLKKCASGFYDGSVGDCLGTGIVCRNSCPA